MTKALQTIWIHVTADRKRFVIMCSLAGVGLLLWGRLIILEKVSRTSYAEPEKAPAVEPQPTATMVGPLPELPVVRIKLAHALTRDAFASQSPLLTQAAQTESASPLTPKSEVDPSEESLRREQERIERIRSEAEALTLESVILGASPLAILDGQVVRIGGVAHGFVVEEINDRSVAVSKDGVRVRIEMDTPVSGH